MSAQSPKQVLLFSEQSFPHRFIQDYFHSCGYSLSHYSLDSYQDFNTIDAIEVDMDRISGIVLSGMIENADISNLPRFIGDLRERFSNIPILLLCNEKIEKSKRLEISNVAKESFKALQGFEADKSVEKDLQKLTLNFFN